METVVRGAVALVALAVAGIVLVQVIDETKAPAAGMLNPTRQPTAAPATDARRMLAELTVEARSSLTGYDRDLFPHWSTIKDNCDTRELVLLRDGDNVDVGPDCAPTSGNWRSLYDGATWTDPSDLDIDHVVPLAHAWVSGAVDWTTDQREAFANDLNRPQLLAVTDNVNQSKSDQAPDEWRPSLSSGWCVYAGDWIAVKHHYRLTITAAEKTALVTMLDRC